MSDATQIEERAASWLARRQEADWTDSDQALLDAWLAESTAHQVAYLRLEYGWSKADRLAALRGAAPQAVSALLKDERQSRRSSRYAWSAAAALVVIIIAGLAWRSDMFAGRTYATDVGGHETEALSDGSRIELNTDTRVRAAFTHRNRRVWLEQGEAYFDVAQDRAEPFVVYAGAHRLTVMATKFSIRLQGDTLKVAVVEGRVRVDALESTTLNVATFVAAGDTALATGAATRIASKSIERVASELSWRRGILIYDQTTLADAASEFNRYNKRKLLVTDNAAEIRIGGSFAARDVDAFVRILQNNFGLKTANDGAQIRISH